MTWLGAGLVAVGLGVGILLIRTTGSWWTWRGWVALSFLALLVGSVIYGQLDGLLRGMHILGGPHYGISNVAASPFHPSPLPAPTVVGTWATWYAQPDVGGVLASPQHVATLALLVDWFIIIPSYALLLLLLLRRGRGVLEAKRRALAAAPPARPGAHTSWTYVVLPVVERWSSWGTTAVGVAVAADLVENFVTLSAINGYARGSFHPSWLLWALPYLTLVKLFGLASALISLVLVGIALIDLHREKAHQLYRAFVALRGQLVLLGVLAVAVLLAPPALDAIRGLGPVQWTVTIAVAVALAWVAWAFGRRALPQLAQPPPRIRPRPSRYIAVGAGFLALALVPGIFRRGVWWGALIPAGFWLLVGLTALRWDPPASGPGTQRESFGFGRIALPRLFGAAVLVLVGLATVKATVGSVVLTPKTTAGGPLIVLGVGLILGGWGLHAAWARFFERNPPVSLREGSFPWVVGVALLFGGVLWIRLVQNVWAVADSMGTIGVVLAFLLMASILVGILVLVAERVNPPNLFRLFGFTRIPVFVLFFAWFFLSSYLPVGSGYHDVRYLSTPTTAVASGAPPLAPGQGVAVADVLRRWLANQTFPGASAAGTSATPGSKTRIPLLLVATSGGGIKAAYWTATVLDCVLDASPVSSACSGGGALGTRPVLAASGISGGSVGLVEFLADQVQRAKGQDPGTSWVGHALGGDFQAPAIAWQLAVELPRAFLQFNPRMDRAEVLERSWQQAWAKGPWTASPGHLLWGTSGKTAYEGPLGLGLRQLWYGQASPSPPSGGAPIPLLLLNGTSVSDGCRFNTSVLDAHGPGPGGSCQSVQGLDEPATVAGRIFPSTRDLDQSIADVGCGAHRDIRLSTAALLSARFPFVSPSGRLTLCGADPPQAAYVVDGGYLDGSGASTILDLWQVLDPLIRRYNQGDTAFGGDPARTCLVPYLVQIDSGYAEPVPAGPTKRPHELKVPSQTQSVARGAVSSSARQEAGLLFENDPGGVYGPGRFAQFFLHGHPGVEAPLAWVLSHDAAADLVGQLKANMDSINTVRGWLQPGQRCPAR